MNANLFSNFLAMISRFNFDEVKKRYKLWYRLAIREQHYTLPFYEIQSWDKILDPVAHNIFDDIKCLGVPLYPIYPISEFDYIHFGNPFIKVGIEIAYKNSSRERINRKVKELQGKGWTIYVTDSRKTHYTFREYYEYVLKDKSVQFDDMEAGEQSKFIKQHKDHNTGCLLEYVRDRHFSDYYYGLPSDSMMTMVDCLRQTVQRYNLVG